MMESVMRADGPTHRHPPPLFDVQRVPFLLFVPVDLQTTHTRFQRVEQLAHEKNHVSSPDVFFVKGG
jgi:hypothetical protein